MPRNVLKGKPCATPPEPVHEPGAPAVGYAFVNSPIVTGRAGILDLPEIPPNVRGDTVILFPIIKVMLNERLITEWELRYTCIGPAAANTLRQHGKLHRVFESAFKAHQVLGREARGDLQRPLTQASANA